jgi:hypothetical protein
MKKVSVAKKQAMIQKIMATKAQQALVGGIHCAGHCKAV